jgi:CheY-like chemotaxis protein
MTGEMLALEVLHIRPDFPIVLCSGLGSTPQMASTMDRLRELGVQALLSKPFERIEIARILRQLLDQPADQAELLCPES